MSFYICNCRNSDASVSNEALLISLGATVSKSLAEGITHFVTSNSSKKRIMAAELMDILVVSPLWLEQCKESGEKVPEEDFLFSAISSKSNNLPTKTPIKIVEPVLVQRTEIRSIDDPYFSSSQREYFPDLEEKGSRKKSKLNNEKSSVVPAVKAAKSVAAPKVSITVDKKAVAKESAAVSTSKAVKTAAAVVSVVEAPVASIKPLTSKATANVAAMAPPVAKVAPKVVKPVAAAAKSSNTSNSSGSKAATQSNASSKVRTHFPSIMFYDFNSRDCSPDHHRAERLRRPRGRPQRTHQRGAGHRRQQQHWEHFEKQHQLQERGRPLRRHCERAGLRPPDGPGPLLRVRDPRGAQERHQEEVE